MIKYVTLLDLARQRARDLARSPNRTRRARQVALDIERTLEKELDAYNRGCSSYALLNVRPPCSRGSDTAANSNAALRASGDDDYEAAA